MTIRTNYGDPSLVSLSKIRFVEDKGDSGYSVIAPSSVLYKTEDFAAQLDGNACGLASITSDHGLTQPLSVDSVVQYANKGVGVAWVGDLKDASTGLPITLRFDLGRSYDLWEVILWNSLWTDTSRGVKSFDLRFFGANNAPLGSQTGLHADRGTPHVARSQSFKLDSVVSEVRYVEMTIYENHGNPSLVSFSKLRFGGGNGISGLAFGNEGGVVSDGVAYFTYWTPYDEPHVVAFDANTFELIRRYDFDAVYDSAPLVLRRQDGTSLVIAHEHENARTVAMNADTGDVVWISEANQQGRTFFGYSYYERSNGAKILYVAATDGLVALSVEDGSTLWTLRWMKGGTTPAVDRQRGVLYKQYHHGIAKIDAVTGEVLVERSVAGPAFSGSWNTVLVDDEHGYYVATRWMATDSWSATYSGAIRVFDAELDELWSRSGLPHGKKDTLTYFDGQVVVGPGNHGVVDPHESTGRPWKQITSYGVAQGDVRWHSDLSDHIDNAIFNIHYYNGYLIAETQFTPSGSDKILRLDASTGQVVDVFDRGFAVTSCAPSVIAGGKLYSGNILKNRVEVVEFAVDSTLQWKGVFGDPQRNTMNGGQDQATFVPMRTLFYDPPSHVEIAQLIRQAGNAEEDAVRLDLLKRLQAMPGLDDRLKTDIDRMVVAIERWTDYRNLTYFGATVAQNMDYDFGITPDSPVYPLTCLYRGRMLVWTALESGNSLWNDMRRRKFLDTAVDNFQQARTAFPHNPIVRMYLGEPIQTEVQYAVPTNAPQWARWQRENIERLTDIICWWIDNRMQPDGQFGGTWGDDVEMWRWWVPVLMGFDDPKIAAAQTLLSEAVLGLPHMQGGYTSQMSDVQHAAEDSADTITPMMHLTPHDPAWTGRAMRLAELMETPWTGKNDRGLLQYKSTYFTVDGVDENPQRAADTFYHPRAVQPALLLWQRTRDEQLTSLFSAWMDTWVDAAARAERGKPAGILPTAIRWPDGQVGGIGEDWWDPGNHESEPALYAWPSRLDILNDTLLLTYHMTGDEKYLEPLRSMAAIRLEYLRNLPISPLTPGSRAWAASQLGFLASTLAKYKALTGSTEFDELLQHDYAGLARAFPTDDSSILVQRLRESAEGLSVNIAGYTSEVRWTDRVLSFPVLFGEDMMFPNAISGISEPDPTLLYSLVTGDPGAAGYFPLNAVRWRTPPRDIAALVTGAGVDHFSAQLFHFGLQPRSMSADLYLLSPGRYTFTVSNLEDDGGEATEILRRSLDVTGAVTRADFDLPPQQLVRISLTQQ